MKRYLSLVLLITAGLLIISACKDNGKKENVKTVETVKKHKKTLKHHKCYCEEVNKKCLCDRCKC